MPTQASVRDLRLVVQRVERDLVRERARTATIEDDRDRRALGVTHLEDFSFDAGVATSVYVPWKGDRTEGATLGVRRSLIVPFDMTITRVRVLCETNPVGMTLTWRDGAGADIADASTAIAGAATLADEVMEFGFDLDVRLDEYPLVALFISGMTNAPGQTKGVVDMEPMVEEANPKSRT